MVNWVILLLPDEGGAGGQEFVVELQETVLVSEGEGEGMAVHRFAPDELVIQDAVEDVVSEYVHCDEDEDVAVETCVMALEGDEEGVAMGDIPEDGLDPEQQEDDQDGCGDYLMISCKYTALFAIRCAIAPRENILVPFTHLQSFYVLLGKSLAKLKKS